MHFKFAKQVAFLLVATYYLLGCITEEDLKVPVADPEIIVDTSNTTTLELVLQNTPDSLFTFKKDIPENQEEKFIIDDDSEDEVITALKASVTDQFGNFLDWITISLEATSTPTTAIIGIDTANLSPGQYSTIVTVESDDVDIAPVSFDFKVTYQAMELQFSTTMLSLATHIDDNPANHAAILQIESNIPEASIDGLVLDNINYTNGIAGWIENIVLDETSTPTQLSLQTNLSNLSAGNYSAEVSIGSTTCLEATSSFQVDLQVLSPTDLLAGEDGKTWVMVADCPVGQYPNNCTTTGDFELHDRLAFERNGTGGGKTRAENCNFFDCRGFFAGEGWYFDGEDLKVTMRFCEIQDSTFTYKYQFSAPLPIDPSAEYLTLTYTSNGEEREKYYRREGHNCR